MGTPNVAGFLWSIRIRTERLRRVSLNNRGRKSGEAESINASLAASKNSEGRGFRTCYFADTPSGCVGGGDKSAASRKSSTINLASSSPTAENRPASPPTGGLLVRHFGASSRSLFASVRATIAYASASSRQMPRYFNSSRTARLRHCRNHGRGAGLADEFSATAAHTSELYRAQPQGRDSRRDSLHSWCPTRPTNST